MNAVLRKLSQPSSWAGIGLIITVFAPYITQAAHTAQAHGWLPAAAVALSGVVAVIKDEEAAVSTAPAAAPAPAAAAPVAPSTPAVQS